ncbi:DUF4197 domain-containing protein [Christiangramia fulva]|uniref:DUF4197 domain-containing protein n=1 Tax=Christiangramia fulva TaxID=2126553 RepID=A0A2R3Z5X5_9FLAO|nr:DUF4197 domain-containing protein [Christiangramia fulva]AVR45681.1 DUF4197 domain-containing protein [Christiangramia fulva]
MQKLLVLSFIFMFTSCAELQNIASQLPQDYTLSDAEISSGLKQALQFGIDREVTKLAEENGFYNNELVRITLPPELRKVDKTLRDIGLDALADKGLMVLNHAAEDAVKEAIPVFTNAVTQMSINDARNILFGPDNAATNYLQNRTSEELYRKFSPIISNSLDKVGATEVWKNIIDRYNAIPLTNNVNPDLPDYVTNEALDGVFTMISIEEKDIRNDLSARTTQLLKRVFGAQD